MCVVSAVGDNYRDWYKERWWSSDGTGIMGPGVIPTPSFPISNPIPPWATKEDLEEIKKSLEEIKKVLIAAKLFDEATGQKDCEMDEKVELLKTLGRQLGVDMEEVFK